MLGVILYRLTKNSILMNEISENTLNEELNKLFFVKIQFRENYTRLSTTLRSKIWSEETQKIDRRANFVHFRKSHVRSHMLDV